MAFRLVGLAAELRQNQRLNAVAFQLHLAEIHMAAVHIALISAEPAGGGIDESSIVQFFEPVEYIVAVKLTPCFVENGPVADARMILQLLDCSFHSLQKSPAADGICMQPGIVQLLDADRGQCRVPQEIVVAVIDHILPDDHAQLVALIIEFF